MCLFLLWNGPLHEHTVILSKLFLNMIKARNTEQWLLFTEKCVCMLGLSSCIVKPSILFPFREYFVTCFPKIGEFVSYLPFCSVSTLRLNSDLFVNVLFAAARINVNPISPLSLTVFAICSSTKWVWKHGQMKGSHAKSCTYCSFCQKPTNPKPLLQARLE